MGIRQRSIVERSADIVLSSASAVESGDDSLSAREDYIAPLSVGVNDQASEVTQGRRQGLDQAFIEAKTRASAFIGDGAAGLALKGDSR
jgi:hypothetical protein